MRIKNQDEILKLSVRKKIIEDIEGPENKRRKDEAYRRRQCYKDKTNEQVKELLEKQFSSKTVDEMSYAITNLSIVKKVVKKLARVYKDGVTRVVPEDKETTDKIHNLAEILNFTERVKNQNRITRLQMNGVLYIKPCKYLDNEGEAFWRPRPTTLHPYLYDVVEDFYDNTNPMAYVLSNYDPQGVIYTTVDPATVRGNETSGSNQVLGVNKPKGNNVDDAIADSPEDDGRPGKEYIWWTGKYHFTTNSMGQVIRKDGSVESVSDLTGSEEEIQNPIEEKPFVPTAKDQDNSFWAVGGDDLVDGSIVVNSLMTQNNHIAVVQGYGQYFMTGKNLPDNVETGPAFLVKMEYDLEAGDPVPHIGVVNANPPLTELQSSILSQVALILTTNDLSTSGLSANLEGGSMFPSGVAMIIDKSESLEDVNDEREMFADVERKAWNIISKFLQYFNEQEELDPELTEYILPEEFDLHLEFGEPKVIFTEAEKLEVIAKRKELGLNTDEELIMIDRKDMTEDAAKAKLEQIKKQKQDKMNAFASGTNSDNEGNEEDENEEDDDDSNEDQ